MQHTRARVIASLAFGAALLAADSARAQSDAEFAVPDVLLLVDSSGSMAYTTVRDPDNPMRYALPRCAAFPDSTEVDSDATDFNDPTKTPMDRWAMLVEVLTGKSVGPRCSAQARNSNDFLAEFKLGGTTPPGAGSVLPYDAGYYLPYNRIVATLVQGGVTKACTPAPSWDATIRQALLDNAIKWPTTATANPVYWRDLGQSFDAKADCPFTPQEEDGLLDQFQEKARFGLMTFDPHPNYTVGTSTSIGTGMVFNGTAAAYPGGVGDTWSYFPDWMIDADGAHSGIPVGCGNTGDKTLLEVGVRNAAAPPWEGRLVGFGYDLAGAEEIRNNNERVQKALYAMRPYGGTPLAGMLEDARYFLLEDATILKENGQEPGYFFGGATDPAVSTEIGKGCRKRYVILLTDGGPNLDLRPDCVPTDPNAPNTCPYQRTPAETAQLLKNNNIPVHVIGFSVSSGGSGSSNTCKQLFDNYSGPGSVCDLTATWTSCTTSKCATGKCAYGYCVSNDDEELKATCCTIKGIADAGGGNAYFPENLGGLKAAFATILAVATDETRSRTQPVFATGNASYQGGNGETVAAARFLSSFDGVPGQLSVGSLERERYKCEKVGNAAPEAKLQDKDVQKGDDFGTNIDTHLDERRIYTVVAEATQDGQIHSGRSIRPFFNETVGDGLGMYGVPSSAPVDQTTKMVSALAPDFPAVVDARSMVSDPSKCTTGKACCWPAEANQTPNRDECRTRFLNLELGYPAGNTAIEAQRQSAFGAMMHATPVLATAPSAFLRDEAYTIFQQQFKARKPVLYAATTDGQLHAFVTNQVDNELNELWTFIPPAMLPLLATQFPDRYYPSPQMLLDGPVIVRDVAGSPTIPQSGRFLSRTPTQAKTATATRWYTVLVGSFGARRGFYALDVSWPDADTAPPTATPPYSQGPRFLWQLTTDINGQPLFGDKSPTPTIATLYFAMPNESAGEHAVAILPGGAGGTRSDTDSNSVQFPVSDGNTDSSFTPRSLTRAYTSDGTADGMRALGGARSVTIVRLDTGEVIRTFRHGPPNTTPDPDDKEAPDGLYTAGRVTNAGFDAPIVGQVVTYPSQAGAVSDRAYLGDAEGKVWRLDLTSTNPADWSAAMMLDAYPAGGISPPYEWTDAKAVATPPIVSTDPVGRVTVAVSTGDQVTFTKSGEHPVWSFTETFQGGKPVAKVNWFLFPTKSIAQNGAQERPATPNGERVTGPMSLFDSILYFTTYDPSAESVATCAAGDSLLWGVHYVNAGAKASEAATQTPANGPWPMLDPNPPDEDPATPPSQIQPANFLRYVGLGDKTVAFGVGVHQKPSCYTVEAATEDPFLGFGAHNTISSATSGIFQLVVQTGKSGSSPTGTETQTVTRNLVSPAGGAQIDSWAAIVD